MLTVASTGTEVSTTTTPRFAGRATCWNQVVDAEVTLYTTFSIWSGNTRSALKSKTHLVAAFCVRVKVALVVG